MGRTLCLDPNSVYRTGYHGKYDLGDPPHAVVNILRDQEYLVMDPSLDEGAMDSPEGYEGGYESYDASYVCNEGGRYSVESRFGGRYRVVELPRNGIVVSSGAIMSMADHMTGNLF
jgi:hypothetical protein